MRAGSHWTPSRRTRAGLHERHLEEFTRPDVCIYAYMLLCECVCPRPGTKLTPIGRRDNWQLKCQRKTLARTDDQHMCELPMNVHMRLWLRIFSSNAALRKRLEAIAVGQKFAPLLDTSTHGLVLWWHPPCPQGSMLTATCH